MLLPGGMRRRTSSTSRRRHGDAARPASRSGGRRRRRLRAPFSTAPSPWRARAADRRVELDVDGVALEAFARHMHAHAAFAEIDDGAVERLVAHVQLDRQMPGTRTDARRSSPGSSDESRRISRASMLRRRIAFSRWPDQNRARTAPARAPAPRTTAPRHVPSPTSARRWFDVIAGRRRRRRGCRRR